MKEYKINWYKVRHINNEYGCYILAEGVRDAKRRFKDNELNNFPTISGLKYDRIEEYWNKEYLAAFNEYYKEDNILVTIWDELTLEDERRAINMWKQELRYRYIKERE